MKQTLFLIILFIILAFLQTSFLAHFTLQGFGIPLVLIGAVVLGMFIQTHLAGFLGVFTGGFVLDIFSQHFFGYWVIIAVLVFYAVSFFTHTYVRFPLFKRN